MPQIMAKVNNMRILNQSSSINLSPRKINFTPEAEQDMSHIAGWWLLPFAVTGAIIWAWVFSALLG
jgi:hypothetical protein